MGTDADKHRYFEGMAVAHVLGGLDESDGHVFRLHLVECPDCRAHVGELRALAHELADAERDERRVRAARAVETKRREDVEEDEEDASAPAAAARFPRLLALVAVLVLVGLGAWNLALRSTITNHQTNVAFVTEAAELLAVGGEVAWEPEESGIDASIKMRDDRLVLFVTGLDESSSHAIFQLDDSGRVIASQPADVEGDRLFYLVPLLDSVRRVVVARSVQGAPDGSTGEWVLSATLR